jgi:hypothetical protein
MAGRHVERRKHEEITTMRIIALLAALGVVVALGGQSHADEKAAITGDFVIAADEVNP